MADDLPWNVLSDIVGTAILDDQADPESWTRDAIRDADAELWNLARGRDADYSVAGIGRMYASWYHLRRVRTALCAVHNSLDTGASLPLTVIDLGCGTGATAWALAALGKQIRYVGVDSSGPMLRWARLLWGRFSARVTAARSITPQWLHMDFIDALRFGDAGTVCDWLAMSFLLDSTTHESLRSRSGTLRDLISTLGASVVLCLTAPYKRDRYGTDALLRSLSSADPLPLPSCTVANVATDLCISRALLAEQLGVDLIGTVTDGSTKDCIALLCLRDGTPPTSRASPYCVRSVARRLRITPRELITRCTDEAVAGAESFHFGTRLRVGLVQSLHTWYGRHFRSQDRLNKRVVDRDAPPNGPRGGL